MNLFAVSTSPRKCARALDDSRLGKMQLETAQMLCTEFARRGYSMPYRPTHASHPVVVWLRNDAALYWMIRYFDALHEENVYRRDKAHGAYRAVRKAVDRAARAEKLRLSRKPAFVNCARNSARGVDFAHVRPTTRAYRLYLVARWDRDARTPTWGRRKPPMWRTRGED